MYRIGIIAGHCDRGTGAHGKLDEGAETIIMRDMVADICRRRGYDVFTDDNKMALSKVVTAVNRALMSVDYCVDIHFNASSDITAHGCETVIADAAGNKTLYFADEMLAAVCQAGGFKRRDVKREHQTPHKILAMCRDTRPHTTILEICFCTNESDVRLYQEHKQTIANAIADVLIKYSDMPL